MADRPAGSPALEFASLLSKTIRATPFGRLGRADRIGMLRRADALGLPNDTARKMLADAMARPRCRSTAIGE